MLTEAVSGVAFNSRFTAVVNHVDAEVVLSRRSGLLLGLTLLGLMGLHDGDGLFHLGLERLLVPRLAGK